MNDWKIGLVRVLDHAGYTVGTGFLVNPTTVVTCAHVVELANAGGSTGGEPLDGIGINLRFYAGGASRSAKVVADRFRASGLEDIALLELESEAPPEAEALQWSYAEVKRGDVCFGFGFPANRPEGYAARYDVVGSNEIFQDSPAISFRSEEFTAGYSGSPLWSEVHKGVVGVGIFGTRADQNNRLEKNGYARPASLVRSIMGDSAECPYSGLDSFTEERAQYYYGRTAAIRRLSEMLSDEGRNLVAIAGSSGSGKSSLVRAGLKRAADEAVPPDFARRTKILLEPGSLPFLDLIQAIMRQLPHGAELWRTLFGQLGGQAQDFNHDGTFREPGRVNEALLNVGFKGIADALEGQLQGADHLLIVDQFERIYTQGASAPGRESFLDLLVELARRDFKVLLVMRVDFIDRLMSREDYLPVVTSDALFLSPLTGEELHEAIVEPAARSGRSFETGLVELLVSHTVNKAGTLPLLQFTLKRLWDFDKTASVISRATLERIGFNIDAGLAAVFANKAGIELGKFRDCLPSVTRILSSLIVLTGQNAPRIPTAKGSHAAPSSDWHSVRTPLNADEKAKLADAVGRRAYFDELSPEDQEVAQKLADSFLLTTEQYFGRATFSLAHESLIHTWVHLGRLIISKRAWIEWYGTTLAPLMKLWIELGKEKTFYLPEAVTKEAEAIFKLLPEFNQGEVRVLYSQTLRNDRNAKWARIAAVLIVALAALGIGGDVIYNSKKSAEQDKQKAAEAKRQAVEAEAGRLRAEAERDLYSKNYLRAEIAAAKSVSLSDSEEARRTLLQARSGGTRYVADSHHQQADDLGSSKQSVLSHDGKVCGTLTGSDPAKATLSVMETESRRVVWQIGREIIAETGMPDCMVISQKKGEVRYLAYARADHTVGIWELRDNVYQPKLQSRLLPQEQLGKHEARIPSMAFHPSQPWIAVCGEDKKICLWDYSQNPARLLWERQDAHGTAVHGIAFNEDGSLLGSGGGDYLVKVWSTDQIIGNKDFAEHPIEPVYKLEGHTDSVFAVAFSPDNKRIASGGYDRIVRIWNIEIDQHPSVATLYGHEGTVLDLVFSKDSKLLISGSKDKTAKLWEVSEGRILLTLTPECGVIRSVACDDFDGIVGCGGESGWSLASLEGRREAARLWNGGAAVGAIAFDPKGEFIAVGGSDGKVRLWDKYLKRLNALDPHLEGEYINGVCFSADGRWLAAAGEGKVVHVWDRSKGWERVTAIQAEETGGKPFMHHEGAIWGLAFDPKGRWLVSGNTDKEMRIKQWEIGTWSLLRQSPEEADSFYSLGFSPDGEQIYSGEKDAWLKAWNSSDLKQAGAAVQTVSTGEKNVWSVTVCPAPLCVFSGNSNGHVYCWKPGEAATSGGTSDADAEVNPTINSVSYNPLKKWVAAGGDGNSIEIYDASLERVASLKGHEGTVWWVTFDPSGKRLAYGGADRMIRIWNIDEMESTGSSKAPADLYRESQENTGLSIEDGRILHTSPTAH